MPTETIPAFADGAPAVPGKAWTREGASVIMSCIVGDFAESDGGYAGDQESRQLWRLTDLYSTELAAARARRLYHEQALREAEVDVRRLEAVEEDAKVKL